MTSGQNETIRAALIEAGHTPYGEVTSGHRIGETKSGFVIITSGDDKTMIRVRPGDDWMSLVQEAAAAADLTKISTAEYACILNATVGYSRTLKDLGYDMGQRNTHTLVVLNSPTP